MCVPAPWTCHRRAFDPACLLWAVCCVGPVCGLWRDTIDADARVLLCRTKRECGVHRGHTIARAFTIHPPRNDALRFASRLGRFASPRPARSHAETSSSGLTYKGSDVGVSRLPSAPPPLVRADKFVSSRFSTLTFSVVSSVAVIVFSPVRFSFTCNTPVVEPALLSAFFHPTLLPFASVFLIPALYMCKTVRSCNYSFFCWLIFSCNIVFCRLHSHAEVIGRFQCSQWRESSSSFFSSGMISNRIWCRRLNTCEMRRASRMWHWHATVKLAKRIKWSCPPVVLISNLC